MSELSCRYGIRGTYIGAGSDPVDGCRESEKPDDGNHGCSRSELEVFVHILSLWYRFYSVEIKTFGRKVLTMIFQRSIAGSCYEFPGIERASQTTGCSGHRHTLTYPARVRSDEFQALRGGKTHRVHPC